MKTSRIRSSLIWRLSLGLLLLLTVLGILYVVITAYSARKYYQETTQRLNADVAEQLLHVVKPFVDGRVNKDALGDIMHSMMAVNPSLEVYLVDPNGQILSYVVVAKDVRLKSIDLNPIKKFLATKGNAFILGDDPRQPGTQTVFSAARVEENGVVEGYVYIVLASAKYESTAHALATGYFLKVGTTAFTLSLVAAFLIGLLLIYYLTKNLRTVIQTVHRFSEGDYEARVPIKSNNELASVGRTFNQMADTIRENMDELKQVDTLRRELIANVSHDLRSPMAVIQGYIETMLLKEPDLTPEDRDKYLKIVLRSSEKLEKLVRDLFDLSKLESEQLEVHKEPFYIHEYIDTSMEDFALQARNKGVELELKTDSDLPPVLADIQLMQRVIQNLMENAVKYTPGAGKIIVQARKGKQGVELSIANSGPGIPESEIPNLFDRFYQIEKGKSRTDKVKDQAGGTGSGLGLAIVKKILEIHDSIIRVSSQKNELTTFSFDLPLS